MLISFVYRCNSLFWHEIVIYLKSMSVINMFCDNKLAFNLGLSKIWKDAFLLALCFLLILAFTRFVF